MLMTYQHIYYSKVYKDFLENFKSIDKITLQTVNEWREMIDNNPNQPLLSFSDSDSNNTDNEVKMIINLSNIRNHIIGLILKNTKYKSTL